MEEIKKKVRDWWNSSPCCSKITRSSPGTKEFYGEVDFWKDKYESFTNEIADYSRWKDKNILEIGCGLGKDFSRFASAGARATGIDMSSRSLELTAKRLEMFGLKRNLCLADAENLPFKDNVFDLVFSWGVLHHTPNTQEAINEVYRCLKTGSGKTIVMLYNKHSLCNLEFSVFSLLGLKGYDLLRKTIRLFIPKKWFSSFESSTTRWGNLNKQQLLAAFTDGVGNPLSKVYSYKDARRMFSRYKNISILTQQPKGGMAAEILNYLGVLGKRLGWFMVIKAEK